VSREIEQQIIDPLEPAVRQAVSAMDQVATLVASAKRDCSE
jgi:hypothetical protein